MKRYKKIGPIRICDIWFDTDAFLAASDPITVLHSNSRLDESSYDLRTVGKTFLLDISTEPDAIFHRFEAKSCRYCIRKAIKDGVQVKKAGTEAEVEEYIRFENAFCQEREIPGVTRDDLKELDVFYAIDSGGGYLGGCAFLKSETEKLVRYKYGATLHKLNANEIILWEAICHYHDLKYQHFDFGGVHPTEDQTSYYYRHYSFKKKFGGELIDSYCYYRLRGIYKPLFRCGKWFVDRFFAGDLNGATNWLNKLIKIK